MCALGCCWWWWLVVGSDWERSVGRLERRALHLIVCVHVPVVVVNSMSPPLSTTPPPLLSTSFLHLLLVVVMSPLLLEGFPSLLPLLLTSTPHRRLSRRRCKAVGALAPGACRTAVGTWGPLPPLAVK